MEYEETRASIAREIIELSGLSSAVEVMCSDSASAIAELARRGQVFDLVFLDHHKDLYLRDLKLMERTGLIRSGTVLFADNVIFPGTPEYLNYVRTSTLHYRTKFYECDLEYTSTDRKSANCPYKRVQDEIVRDGVEISTYVVDENAVKEKTKPAAWNVFDEESSSSSSDDDDDEDDEDDTLETHKEFFFESCMFLKNSCPNMEHIVDEKLKPCIRAAHLACEQRDVARVLSTTRKIREECWRQIKLSVSSSSSSSSLELLRSIISEVSVTYAAAVAVTNRDLRHGLRAVDEGLIFAPGEAGSLRRRMLRRVADMLTLSISSSSLSTKDDSLLRDGAVILPYRNDEDETCDIPVLSSDVSMEDFKAAISSIYRPVLVRLCHNTKCNHVFTHTHTHTYRYEMRKTCPRGPLENIGSILQIYRFVLVIARYL